MRSVQITSALAFLVAATLLPAPAFAQCSSACADNPPMSLNATDDCSAESTPDLVGLAAGAKDFSTLVAAVKAAGLVPALQGEGPFTIFAPTNDAFAKLPKGTVETLLKPENIDQLTAVLTYHVVPGKVKAKQVVGLTGATTLQGQRLDISVGDAGVTVDGARVLKTDLMASNGVIHVIDTVMLPTSENLAQVAEKAGSFGTLIAAAKAAGLVPALTGTGPLTIFAPTDEAFAALPAGTVETLLKPENREQLASILKLHVVSGRIDSTAAIQAGQATALSGGALQIRHEKGAVRVNDALVTTADVDASNGVIHVIDRVLLP